MARLTVASRRLSPRLAAAILVFVTTGYFQNTQPRWGVSSQFAAVCALVERGTLCIDDYHEHPELETGDKALVGGHFYSDKSPVTSFLGVPAYFSYWLVKSSGGRPIKYATARYWTTWWTIGTAAAAVAWMVATLLMRHGVDETAAAPIAALWIASTPLLGYSILFYNYLPACAGLMGGYLAIEPTLRSPAPATPPASRLFVGGALFGVAAWTLATVALAALIASVALAVRLGCARCTRLWSWVGGGLAGALGYAIYGWLLFGRIASPYEFEYHADFRDGMAQGLMGAGWPDPYVMLLITVHPFRGLFLHFPATAIAFVGVTWAIARSVQGRPSRTAATPFAVALALFAGLVLYCGGYFMWWGGWSYAPRHLIPGLPLLSLGLVPWARGSAWTRGVLVSVLVVGAATNASAVAVDPQPPPGLAEEALLHPASVSEWPSPFFDLLRAAWAGGTDKNWGTRLGLRGLWSLAPLGALWCIALARMSRHTRGSGGTPVGRDP